MEIATNSQILLGEQASSNDCDIGPYYIRGCLQGAVSKGHDPESLLRAAQIDTSVYHDPSARINGEELQRLFLTIRNALNDEYLGFLDVQGKLEMSYLVCRTTVRSETFGQAMVKMARLVNAVRSDIEMGLDTDCANDQAAIFFKNSGVKKSFEPHFLSWFSLYWAYKFQCWLIGRRIKLTKVLFSSSKPKDAIDYSRFVDCPIEYNQKCAGLYFSRQYLKAPITRSEIELKDRDFAFGSTNWFEISGKDQTFSTQVEQMLLDLYREGVRTPNLDVLGDILRCSARTLSRKLKKEGVTFQELKVKVRREMAQKLLLSTEMSVAEIAERVGFSEPADFTRAYVSWTGRTPSGYRAQRHN
ncbi:MAG: AraC family transcriptional regulator [Pseudomonadota bacterium]